MIRSFFLYAIAALCTIPSIAQDTVTVQCFDFNDITKRRGVYAFPDGSEDYRKVIMEYTLKCDSRTTQDNFDCGEWDYLTYNYVYDHRGIYDSTYQSGPNFRIGSSTPSEFNYTNTSVFDVRQDKQYKVTRLSTIGLTTGTVGSGVSNSLQVLDLTRKSGRSQYVYGASDLTGSGLSGGDITGIGLDVTSLTGAVVDNFEVLMGHTSRDTIDDGVLVTGLTSVYRYSTSFSPGANSLQFPTAFTWNGTDNLVVEFRFDNKAESSSGLEIAGDYISHDVGSFQQASEYVLEFNGNQQEINIGAIAEIQGSGAKTIEAWAYTESFNNAGIWQAGRRGATGQDYSLRTTTTSERWRVQHWGTPDYDVTLPGSGGAWRHYAVTYDGSKSRLYVDGVEVASENAGLNTGSLAVQIGRWQGNFFRGKIDAIRIWDVALPANYIIGYMGQVIQPSHPLFSNLVAAYNFNEGTGSTVTDYSGKNRGSSATSNYPWWQRIYSGDFFKPYQVSNLRPQIIFEQGTYTSQLDSVMYYDTIYRAPVSIIKFDNPSNGTQIADNASNHPTIPTDTVIAWEADLYRYIYDHKTGAKVDSVFVNRDVQLTAETKEWYSPMARFEIGRFITPYGIGLDLGPDGFTWWYDVTDYLPLLVDSVDLSAGNQQELIDLKFHFIKGSPIREVKGINRVWGPSNSYSYRNLDNDVSLPEKTIDLIDGTSSWKMRTRFTGHGHNSDNGQYPHCCEWKDNEHYLYVNGNITHSWHIWQTHDCALNPVYPQGGTWPGAREGWCPGDVVKDFDFEIADFISGNTVALDYDITPVPSNNQGMGSGNYRVAMQLFQYGDYTYERDVEIYELISPSPKAYNARKSLVCQDPVIVIRNNGSQTLTQLNIYYSVSGGVEWTYPWAGTLKPMEMVEVSLPVTGQGFWTGDGSNMFKVEVAVLGEDQYPDDNVVEVPIELPQTYAAKMVLDVRSNSAPNENAYEVRTVGGGIVVSNSSLSANTTYRDTLDASGCYVFEMTDSQDDGLSYWARPGQGSGSVRIFELNASDVIVGLKAFEPEFGHRLRYDFSIGTEVGSFPASDTGAGPGTSPWLGINEQGGLVAVSVFPNPADDNFELEMIGLSGEVLVEMVDISGKVVLSKTLRPQSYHAEMMDVNELSSGLYFVKVSSAGQSITRKITLR